MAEKGVKALKTKKISACISKAFYVYSKYEVGESGAKCAKVVLLTQKCRRVEPSDFPEKRGSRCFALFTAASRIAERGKRFDRPVSAQHRRQGQSVHPRKAPRGAGRDPEDFNWDLIFDKADWFHWTGITPALGGRLPEICKAACKAAKERQIPISCDLNFRKKLWTRERANAVMQQLMPYVDVCIANEEDAKNVFGIVSDGTDIEKAQINKNGYIDVARQLTRKFGFRKVAFTLRTSLSANDNDWMGMLYNGEKDHAEFSPQYHLHIVDRVGGGDSFAGGLIFGMLNGYSDQKALNFAVAASCLKHSIEHDFNMVSVPEVESLVAGDGSGRVQR